jgi:hypothetical protein
MQQVLNESTGGYNSFIDEFSAMVKKMMGEEYTARIYKVTKNNSLELDSLVLLKEGKSFAPNIYLLPYYEAYMEGTRMEELAGRLCTIYHNYTAPVTGENFSYAFEAMKQNIVYRLVSYEKNRKLLKKIPHVSFLDLAIIFHCLVHDNEDGIGTIRITNEHLKFWDISLEELQQLADRNTRRRFPPVIRSMEEVIKGLISEDHFKDDDLIEEMRPHIPGHQSAGTHGMYILSNPKGINGAACLLYNNVLKRFSDRVQSDLFILPSSIHEVILVPDEKTVTREILAAMVKDVNRTQVAGDEVLSDRVYYYSRGNNAITM